MSYLRSNSKVEDLVILKVELNYCYTLNSKIVEDVKMKLIDNSYFNLTDIINELELKGINTLIDSVLYYFDNDLQRYIYCGKTPLITNISIPYNLQDIVKYIFYLD